MIGRRLLASILCAGLMACAAEDPTQRSFASASAPGRPVQTAPPLAVGDRAPPFVVLTSDGATIDSADVLGKRPLVLVFFTTWCPWCERTMPLVREGLAGAPADVLIAGVSLDTDTWSDVPAYVKRHGIEFPIVRAEKALEFTRTYDRGGRIPHLVVVGRDGIVVDIQPGYDPDCANRLRAALELAGRGDAR